MHAMAKAEVSARVEELLGELRGCMARSPIIERKGPGRAKLRYAGRRKLSAKLQSIAIGPPVTMIAVVNTSPGGHANSARD